MRRRRRRRRRVLWPPTPFVAARTGAGADTPPTSPLACSTAPRINTTVTQFVMSFFTGVANLTWEAQQLLQAQLEQVRGPPRDSARGPRCWVVWVYLAGQRVCLTRPTSTSSARGGTGCGRQQRPLLPRERGLPPRGANAAAPTRRSVCRSQTACGPAANEAQRRKTLTTLPRASATRRWRSGRASPASTSATQPWRWPRPRRRRGRRPPRRRPPPPTRPPRRRATRTFTCPQAPRCWRRHRRPRRRRRRSRCRALGAAPW